MSKDIDKDFGDRFAEIIDGAGLDPKKPTEIAKKIGHDATKQLVSNWLAGSLPRADMVIWIAEAFTVVPRWLAVGDGPKVPKPPPKFDDPLLEVVIDLWDQVPPVTHEKWVAELQQAKEAYDRSVKRREALAPAASQKSANKSPEGTAQRQRGGVR